MCNIKCHRMCHIIKTSMYVITLQKYPNSYYRCHLKNKIKNLIGNRCYIIIYNKEIIFYTDWSNFKPSHNLSK